ncbi:MAG TPA: hypothetical protein VI072_15500 [Polyangiaceae bacterium]
MLVLAVLAEVPADPVAADVPPVLVLVVVVEVLPPAAPVAPAVVAPALVAPGFAVVLAPAPAAFAVPVAVADFVSVPGFVPASCANAGTAAVNPASKNTQQAL